LKWDTCIFSAMRDLTLSYIPQDTIFNLQEFSGFIRTAAPSLQRLAIVGSSPRSSSPDWHLKHSVEAILPLQVYLPRLQELRLEALDLLDIQMFIPLLHSPHLRKLTLSRISRGMERKSGHHVNIESWRNTQWRPDLNYVDQLECSDVEFEGGLFQAICRAAPGIKKLILKGESTNSILEFLTPQPLFMLPDEDIPFPWLQRLEVHEASAEIVRTFVEFRTSTLREVKGTILNSKKVKRSADGLDAVRQLGWEHNDSIHVALRP